MKFVLTVTFLFLVTSSAMTQIIADFEQGTNNFSIGWGNCITGLAQAADPTGASSGALAISFDASGSDHNGALQKTLIEATGGKIITFFLYLPAGTPDSLEIKVWAQDYDWTWVDFKYYAVNIPKDVLYPVHFDLDAAHFANSGFNVGEGTLQKSGIEFATWYISGSTWTGTFYIDNVSLVGVEPDVVADFEQGTSNFSIGWGNCLTNLYQAPDPLGISAGVLALDFNAAGSDHNGAIQKTMIAATDLHYTVTTYIYLPGDTPDSLEIKAWAQDFDWTWYDFKYYAVNIPKEVWYPLHFDLKAAHYLNSSFNVSEGTLQKIGLEMATWYISGSTWTGTIYIDNVSLLGIETGLKWVVANWENPVGGTQGFANTGWNAALTGLTQAVDPSGRTAGVLQSDWDFTLDVKGSFENSNVSLLWDTTGGVMDTGATAITFDVWLPVGIAEEGSQLSIFVRDHDTWTWTEDKFTISDSTVIPGQWNTISYNIVHYVGTGELNPLAGVSVGLQLYYSVANTWYGSIYFDNFTLVGVEKPAGTLVSPPVVASIDTMNTQAGGTYEMTHLEWLDNDLGTESYSVYMSLSPITNLQAVGVIRIGREIPHGTEEWNHRPYSNAPLSRNYYYAVVAVASDGTITDLNDQCKAGPISILTSPTAKVYYDSDFHNHFVLDGLDNEFTATHKQYTITPQTRGGTDTLGWTPQSTDMTFGVTFVIDDDYLYFSADVTDDDLRSGSYQAWEGDALEFYMGMYDVNPLQQWHCYRDVGAAGTGDYRIGFTASAEVQANGTSIYDFPGLESTVYQKFTGDGYIIEARLALDSLALDGDLEVFNGIFLPLRLDGNDWDPVLGPDSSRSLIVQWGGVGNAESWMRPSCWGYLEVVNGPIGIFDDISDLPQTFDLFDNYPNPFNPVTTLKYQVPEKAEVSLIVYDIVGRKIRTLVDEQKTAGVYTVVWNGNNDLGIPVASGIYFYRLHSDQFFKTKKMVLIK